MVNQFVYHIGRTNEELLAFCKDHEILVEGYSPIATGRLLDNDAVKTIAEAYGKSIPQLSIRYLLQKTFCHCQNPFMKNTFLTMPKLTLKFLKKT